MQLWNYIGKYIWSRLCVKERGWGKRNKSVQKVVKNEKEDFFFKSI